MKADIVPADGAKTKAVQIVRATEVDIPFIMAMERLPANEGLVGCWEREQHKQAITDQGNAYFVGASEGTPVGFVIVQHWASAHRATLIGRIIVADTGKKIGRELLSKVIDTVFTETEALQIWLNVHPSNERAQRCYTAIGFRFEDRAKFPVAGESKMMLMILQRTAWRH
ncbi:N-acetyltransferase [Bradyrhizobium sp. LHD-71]|uniref:GNAT family N-acetyltransferase n=1 Tax=Bradyrhizobium sp. LHD-71 TaxID=3072141 RepID=UPI00280D40E3|nr:N-acetyltransferase [Bradyrhizobium sp. LHD-71]MDQ8727606.1 N-acetyltransferase [Bradyrhizobium sp. LHD-71]